MVKEKLLRYLISILVFGLLLWGKNRLQQFKKAISYGTDSQIHIFIQQSCPHCHELLEFCQNSLADKSFLKFYDIGTHNNLHLLLQKAKACNLPLLQLQTPAIFSHNDYLLGFQEKEFKKFLEIHTSNISSIPLATTEKIYLSLQTTLYTALKQLLHSQNISLWLLLLLILRQQQNKILLQICYYFIFLAFFLWLMITSQLDVFFMNKFITFLQLFVSFICIFSGSSMFFNPSRPSTSTTHKWKFHLQVYKASLLTFLAAALTTLHSSDNWQNFSRALPTANEMNHYQQLLVLLLVIVYCGINLLLILAIYQGLQKYKNYWINHLTIINDFLSLISGIFIIFAGG